MKHFNSLKYPLATACVLALSACSTGGTTQTGFSLGITDAPIDSATSVFVQFSGVEIKGKDTYTFTFDTPKQIDLLALQGSNATALLDNEMISEGNYQWITLKVDTAGDLDSYIKLDDGTNHELTIPSGNESGLKLVRGFTVSASGSSDFTIDFDVRKSVIQNVSGYTLKPALRLVDNLEIGHVSGSVSSTLLSNTCTEPNIYAFAGSVTPTDISGATTDPVTTALVSYSEANSLYSYEVGFLETGTYTLGLTCEASSDDVSTVDTIAFVSSNEVLIEANKTTVQDF